MGKAMPQVNMIAAMEMTMVKVSRSPMTSDTGRPHSIAMPKLPCRMRPIHLAYCTVMGLSRPSCSRSAAASPSETALPDADIEAMYEVT